jgi:hypothetical protein
MPRRTRRITSTKSKGARQGFDVFSVGASLLAMFA